MKITMRNLLTLALLALTLAPVAHADRLLHPGTVEGLPRPDHVVVVIEENRGYSQIMGKLHSDSYIHALAKRGVLFTQSYGVTHPSQPNYLALFSGSTQDITSNVCPNSFNTDNLASTLLDAGLSFASFAETLPAVGDLSCMSGAYQRKHNPVTNWPRVPAESNKRFADFPQDFSRLPTVSFVIPDQDHDMHDGSFSAADDWLKTRIEPYVDWAFKHNSLLILTWDEDNFKEDNRVVTMLVGPMVKAGESDQRIDHYNVLRTLLDFYGLPAPGAARDAETIKGVWKKR
jgi:phospholipase C